MEPVNNTIHNEQKKKLWTIIGIASAIVIVVGLLAALGIAMKRSANKSLVVGQDIKDFTVTSFEGETFQKSSLAGKVILVNFWSSWCASCDEEGDALELVWQEVKDSGEVLFLGVNYVDTEKDSMAFLERYGISYPNGPDMGSRISTLFKVTGVPETYIIGRDGRLAAMNIGPLTTTAEVHALLDPVLAGQ